MSRKCLLHYNTPLFFTLYFTTFTIWALHHLIQRSFCREEIVITATIVRCSHWIFKAKVKYSFFFPVAALSNSSVSKKIFPSFFSFYATIYMPLHLIDYKRYFINLRKHRASGTCLIMSKSRPSLQTYNYVELSPLQADSCSDGNSAIACLIS
jgi:hypothetical protein